VVVLRGQLHFFYLFSKAAFVFETAKGPGNGVFKALVKFPLSKEKFRVFFLGKAFLKVEFPLSSE
jgi:hypothetical protein